MATTWTNRTSTQKVEIVHHEGQQISEDRREYGC
jgi:hypothetical protein